MAELTNKQKKEWACTLITKEGLTQAEAAERVGVSKPTMSKWYNEGNWARLKQSLLVTREAQLGRLYTQLDNMTTTIANREEGKNFPDSKEADAMNKLTGAIKTLESEASIADIVEVSKRLLNWLRPVNPQIALQTARILDDFIKFSLSKSR